LLQAECAGIIWRRHHRRRLADLSTRARSQHQTADDHYQNSGGYATPALTFRRRVGFRNAND